MNCDNALDKLNLYLKDYESFKSSDLTESDTRSKIIDFVFKDILGWDEKDIRREGHLDSGFFDYKLSIAGFSLIIEAKRQFEDFVLPFSTKRKVKLGTIYRENKKVIDQIRGYLDDIGCDLGIITNGRQFIIAKFINTNGIPWKDNFCVIYNGIDDLQKHFVEFWNNLSKDSIIENGGINLLQVESIEFSKTILSTISEQDIEITRNDIASKIAPIISKVFGEIFNNDYIDDDIEFIKECYVENNEVIKNKAELNGLFSDDAPLLAEVIKANNQDSIIDQINKEINSYPSQSIDLPTPKPIIIIGSKGAGKTTFINYLFKNSLPDDTICNYPFIYINFMKYYKDDESIDFEEIAKDALEQFNDKYPIYDINSAKVLKRIYIKEIHERDKGIWSLLKENDNNSYQKKLYDFLEDKINNKQEHLKALNLYFTREIHKRIIIVFDNADQLSDSIQEKVFLYSCSLNTSARYGVIVSLREGYYYKWRNLPPFNAFITNVYHIGAPDYGIVLQKRIDYAIKYIKREKERNIIGFTSKGIKIILGDTKIEEFFIGIRGSLFGKENSPILEFIRHNSFPNVREGLRIFRSFLESGYTDVEEYILRVIYNQGENIKIITIPIHEFVKTIALENRLYYNHTTSNIQNIFYPCKDSNDYFLKIWILRRLEEQLLSKGNVSKYLNYSVFIEEFLSYGYKEHILNQELELLIHNGFVDIDKLLSDIRWDKLPNPFLNLTITAKGLYYIQNIINHFYYIDLMLQDLPIYSKDEFIILKSAFPMCDALGKRLMESRLEVVNKFIDYLDKREKGFQPIPLVQRYGGIVDNIKANGLNADIIFIKSKFGIN